MKIKGVCNFKLKALNIDFLPNLKYFGYKTGLPFNNTSSVADQHNYTKKVVNVYIIYNLDHWPRIPLRSFTLKHYLFGVTNIVKNNDKEKYAYSGYGVEFHGKGSWSFFDDFAKTVIRFGVDNSSSSHTDNL